jgi:DNA-directed RNA polymerase subunit RPC12/RpoP
VCNAQNFLTLPQKRREIHKRIISGSSMRHQVAAPTSSLPSLMMPCPVCAGRMVYHGRRAVSVDLEDTIYACRRCGAELVRTSMRKLPKAEAA